MPAAADDDRAAAQRAIDTCTDLTGRMLAAADAGDWETVVQLDGARRPCFEGIDLTVLDGDALVPALERLRALVAMDGRLSSLAGAARRGALEEVRRVRGKARGSARYQQLGYG